jgi:hypothetical protein
MAGQTPRKVTVSCPFCSTPKRATVEAREADSGRATSVLADAINTQADLMVQMATEMRRMPPAALYQAVTKHTR